jgi:hypothetical protein
MLPSLRSIVAALLLALTLAMPTAAAADAFTDALAGLADRGFAKKVEAVDQLGASGDKRAEAVLNALLDRYARLLGDLPGSRHDVREFLGRHLSEPKPHVRFERPVRRSGPRAFARSLTRRGMRPATATIMLYRGNRFFVNGESVTVREDRALLSRLADLRRLE